MPSEIILTPTTSGSTSYRVTWTPSYYNTSRYMLTVYPPESYTQEDLIIRNIDHSTVHNITIALNGCPHRIYSTFIPSKNRCHNKKKLVFYCHIIVCIGCPMLISQDVLNYRMFGTGQMTVHLVNNQVARCVNVTMWEINFVSQLTTAKGTTY